MSLPPFHSFSPGDWLDFVVLSMFALFSLAALLLIGVALVAIRRIRPRDWMPCEAWIALALLGVTWACKVVL